jgi:hypothetical protein
MKFRKFHCLAQEVLAQTAAQCTVIVPQERLCFTEYTNEGNSFGSHSRAVQGTLSSAM